MTPRRTPILWLGAVLTGGIAAIALLSLLWTPEPLNRLRIPLRLRAPLDPAAPLGTDHLGRDLLSQLMAGAWTSLSLALVAVALGMAAGVALGLAAALKRGWLDEAAMRIMDVAFAFPAVLTAIMIATLLGPGAPTAVLAIAAFNIPVFARVARAAALQVVNRDFILAARVAGAGPLHLARRHVLPNIAGVLIVQATIQVALAILAEAGLSFLGIGIAPPTPSWGRMLADSQTYLGQAPWLAILPGGAIALTVLGFNLLGDGLRDRLDPRHR